VNFSVCPLVPSNSTISVDSLLSGLNRLADMNGKFWLTPAPVPNFIHGLIKKIVFGISSERKGKNISPKQDFE
jgi:hypothetical protein